MADYESMLFDEAQQEAVDPAQEGSEATGEEGAKESEAAESSAKGEQSREENNRFRAARQRGDRDGYARAEKEYDAEIEALGRVNPITGAPIKTRKDMVAYFKAMSDQELAARAKKAGKSVEELRDEEEAAKRGRAELEKERESKAQQERLKRDVEEFTEAHPDVNLKNLLESSRFKKFAGKRLGKEPLTELYEDYADFTKEVEGSSAERKEQKAARSTGTGGGSGHESLTAAQQKSLDDWNRMFPSMKMTAKEYLSRG